MLIWTKVYKNMVCLLTNYIILIFEIILFECEMKNILFNQEKKTYVSRLLIR